VCKRWRRYWSRCKGVQIQEAGVEEEISYGNLNQARSCRRGMRVWWVGEGGS